jgi:SAM-dependent methyltransferase
MTLSAPPIQLACPSCGGKVVPAAEGATCQTGHRFPALRRGFDFVTERAGVHYPAGSADQLLRVHREHFWYVERRRLILWWVARHGLGSGATFLDLGTGCGDVAAALRARGLRALAADYYAESDEAVRRVDAEVPFYAVDAYRLPFRELDAVGIFDVLEHLDRPLDALAQIRDSLTRDGWLFVTVPARPELWTNRDLYAGHHLRYDRGTLRRTLARVGFKLVRASYFMLPMALPLALSRYFGALYMPSGLSAEEAEARFDAMAKVPSPSVNFIGSSILSAERWWLRVADIPYGSSIIAAARRVS